ncbi:MAG TPA: IPT/TIG domain-containing protein, partial [Mycobacteriales bacterium]|nr:IPT/TIG domain-containing protein [Mycobacteriales bacterium]
MRPAASYTGRLVGDTLGTMGQGEASLVTGSGSQNTNNLSRWGDYTSVSVDPTDDCTFWYLGEYLTSNGSWNWQTRIGAFKFPSCTNGGGGNAPTVTSFSPTSGPVGTQVDVQGTNFTGATAVTFNGVPDTSFQLNSSIDITAHVPTGATTGQIAVTTPNGTGASASNFTVTGGGGGNPPTISSFTP